VHGIAADVLCGVLNGRRLAEYPPEVPGWGAMPAPEEMLMLEPPPPARMRGMACLLPKKAPWTLMSMVRAFTA